MESYEEKNPPDLTIEEVKQKLLYYDPKIDKSDIKFIYHGSNNVYLIKNEFILKIPDKNLLTIIGDRQIEKEVKILSELRNRLNILVPKPIYVSKNSDNHFYLYKNIPGVSLSRVYPKIPYKNKMTIAENLGNIITELHSLQDSFSELIRNLSLNKSSEQYFKSIQSLFTDVTQKILPILTQKQNNWVTNLFDTFFETQKVPIKLVTTHNDLDTSNILVNPKNNYKISGLIDFETFGLGDPILDLLFQKEGTDFHNSVLNHYSRTMNNNFYLRMNFHKKKTCLFYILTGIDYNLPKMKNAGIKLLDFFSKNEFS
ncbi:MAG: Stress response kinase A [Candidatus Heimdallarchaeota archaeon LC_3]|nr:MAG: Stress response kinase A [Candidatus Heimdallarchaeota archaeon LC_3]